MGDKVEVNCGGKGVWYRCEVTEVYNRDEYQVKYECDAIKWVTDNTVKGTGERNRSCLCLDES